MDPNASILRSQVARDYPGKPQGMAFLVLEQAKIPRCGDGCFPKNTKSVGVFRGRKSSFRFSMLQRQRDFE